MRSAAAEQGRQYMFTIKTAIAGLGLAAAGVFIGAGVAGATTGGGDGGAGAPGALSNDLFGDSGAHPPTDGAFADTFATSGLDTDAANLTATTDWDQFNGDLGAWEEKTFLSTNPSAFDVSLINDFNNSVGYLEEGLFDVSGHGYDKAFSGVIDGFSASGLQDAHFAPGDGGSLSESFSNIDTAGFDFSDLFGGAT